MNSYDVAVIGSGPGGYVAAIRCGTVFSGSDKISTRRMRDPQS